MGDGRGSIAVEPGAARDAARTDAAPSVVLLAGGLRPTPLAAESGVQPIWLCPDGETTLLTNWVHRLGRLAGPGARGDAIDVRVVFDTSRDAAQTPTQVGRARVVFVSESAQYRGPAGVVKDITGQFGSGGVVLIAEANRWLTEDLTPMLAAHIDRGAAVTVARQADGSPAGVYLAGARALDLIPAKGFMDLKEQWLARVMTAGLDVVVHTFLGAGAPAVRTREDLLSVARGSAPRADGPWRVVSGRAEVDPSAVIVESVVMAGARAEAGAIVARSVLAPGSVAAEGSRHVDAVLPGDAARAARMSLEVEDAR